MNRSQYSILLISLFIVTGIAYPQTDSLVFGGIQRSYLVHLPSSYTGTVALPLVIALHNLSGSAAGFETMTGFSAKSDTENIVVVYPNGTGNPASWNCGGSWSTTVTNINDDVGFIAALIDTLAKRYTIDSTRIYVAGFSNGSMMAYRLAAELSNRIAAIAAGSGPMTLRTLHPSHSVAIIHFHALDDSSIPYTGITDSHAPVYFPPIDTLMAIWGRLNGCAAIADTIYNVSGVLGKKWATARTGGDVVLYQSATGGHAWPLGSLQETNLAWSFLKEHVKSSATTNVQMVEVAQEPKIVDLKQNYPNPFNPSTTIAYQLIKSGHTRLTVWNILGQEVATLINEDQSAGAHSVSWNAPGIASGVYFYRLESDAQTVVKKLILLR
jgi:polyhydroxybutyrate depolymerase